VGIRAYVESIHELARFIEARGLQVHSPRAISTAAGTLHPAVRELVERVFRAPVFDHYGSRETNGIAGECDHHQGLHVSALTYRFELLRADGTPCGPGELGEVVLTSLVNYAMPLIRYRIGDMAEWAEQPCSCGRAWPLLRAVQGRVTDNFVAGDGTLVHGAYFRHLFFFRDWIRKFQIVQEAQDRVRFRIVLRTPGEDPRASYA
jgi:phenylacetate-CoA ligase